MWTARCKLAEFPIEENHKLAVAIGKVLDSATWYQRLVGRLIYLTITRAKLTYVVYIVSRFMQSPKEKHMEATRRVLRYLKFLRRWYLSLCQEWTSNL